MFTGLVEALGSVEELARDAAGWQLTLRAPADFARQATLGESVAVNGVCLTVVGTEAAAFQFDLADETLRVTALGDLRRDDPVNLERPLRLGTRLGGHLVLGHVDGVGRVSAVEPEGAGRRLTVEMPPALQPLLIPKGSVAVDGVSLTVASLHGTGFSVALIPHTLAVTTLGRRGVGARVNLEMDVIGKYVRALLPGGEPAREFLEQHGLVARAREE
ncbi:MAG TPA: riboflavin synthase [Methylomirabilota bacterium]|jgi:riboflavin synthase|nr:riboflavin synthase [Methylomirabilota bacterium]